MKKNNGITLITLVITIIVTVILTTVTISTLFGKDGLISKTKQATKDMPMKEEKEAILTEILNARIGKYALAENKDYILEINNTSDLYDINKSADNNDIYIFIVNKNENVYFYDAKKDTLEYKGKTNDVINVKENDITIEYDKNDVPNDKIKICVNFKENVNKTYLKIQYSMDENEWTNYDQPIVTKYSKNVYIRVVFGKDNIIKYTTVANATGVNNITLNHTSEKLTKNTELILTPTIQPENAINKNVTWTSSDSSVATVDENGKITSVNVGTAIITCKSTDGTNIETTCKIITEEQYSYNGSKSQTGSIITFNVPATGKYQFDVAGAAGSESNKYGGYTSSGGNGARIVAEFNLQKGEIIDMIVGGMGQCVQANSKDGSSGGGGGGSFILQRITEITDSRYQFTKGSIKYSALLVVAGGGGSQDAAYRGTNSVGYPGLGVGYKSPNNYTAYSTTTTDPSSSTSTSNTLGISQFISYDAKGAYYTRNSGSARGGYGGGGAVDDAYAYGGGWCNGTNQGQTMSWSLDTAAIGYDGANSSNGYVKIKYIGD